MTGTVGVALVGAGPWGMTLGRAAARLPNVDLRWICELDSGRLAGAATIAPGARLTATLNQPLQDPAVQAVLVAVDSPQHHAVGRRVLQAGRHALIEKPMAMTVAHAAELSALAAAGGRVLSVGHLLLHHPAVRRAREMVAAGAIGEPLWLESTRLATGAGRSPGGAWWTFAPHDVSLALHFFGEAPEQVTAVGRGDAAGAEETVAWATLQFASGRLAHIHVARHAPARRRTFTIVGSRRSLVVDELGPEPLTISPPRERAHDPAEAIPIDAGDALAGQCVQFISAVSRQDPTAANWAHGLQVVKVLEAGAHSMRHRGTPVAIAP